MNLVERVKGISLKPREKWQTISGKTTTIPELYKAYIVMLAAIGPVASIIGMSIVGISLPFAGSFRMPITTSIASAVVHYILTLVGVYILALIIDALAPTFSGEESITNGGKFSGCDAGTLTELRASRAYPQDVVSPHAFMLKSRLLNEPQNHLDRICSSDSIRFVDYPSFPQNLPTQPLPFWGVV